MISNLARVVAAAALCALVVAPWQTRAAAKPTCFRCSAGPETTTCDPAGPSEDGWKTCTVEGRSCIMSVETCTG
jgi:hypothetical protein